MARSKKSKMTDQEYADYVRDAEFEVGQFTNTVNGTLIMFEGLRKMDEPWVWDHIYKFRTLALGSAKTALSVIQDPQEVGDYHQPSLVEWRKQIRRLDVITEAYLRSLYKEKRNG